MISGDFGSQIIQKDIKTEYKNKLVRSLTCNSFVF